MENEILAAIVRANLAIAITVVAVLLLRRGVRRWFGARSAYALWALSPICVIAALIPARRAIDIVLISHRADAVPAPHHISPALLVGSAAPITSNQAMPAGSEFVLSHLLLGAWLLGVVASLAFLMWRQHRYVRSLGKLERRDAGGLRTYRSESPSAIPALVGALTPFLILPRDFETRFNEPERRLILAHERTHLTGADPLINALIAFSTCLFWFNPLAHVAALAIRHDQELACDAGVLASQPRAKRLYAEALLKAQSNGAAVPLGCAWPARGRRALQERISLLNEDRPTGVRRAIGAVCIGAMCVGGAVTAWAAQPVQHQTVFRNAPPNGRISPVQAIASSAEAPTEAISFASARHPLGALQDFSNTQIETFGIAARLRVVPEERGDISVEIAPGDGLPVPTAQIVRGHLVIDGGLGITANNCRTRFSGEGEAVVPGVGRVRAEALPLIVVHVPRQLDLLVRGVVVADIGASNGGHVRIDGCGDARLGDATGALDISLNGFGNVDVGVARGSLMARLYGVGDLSVAQADRDATADLVGSGDLTIGPVAGALTGRMQGSGMMRIGDVGAGAELSLAGSGPMQIGAINGDLNVQGTGSSVTQIAASRDGVINASLNGSVDLNIASGATDRIVVRLDGSDRMNFGGHANLVRATLGAGAGNVTVARADRVERSRAPFTHGDVIIQQKS